MGTLAGHRYVTRAEWGALPSTEPLVPFRLPASRLYVHHTGSEQHGPAGMREIQRYHQNTKGWKDVAYGYLVDDDGTIYEGRSHRFIGGATEGENSTSHAICLMGNFDNRPPTLEAFRALVDLTRHGIANGWWASNIFGHRDSVGAQTACPGRHLYSRLGQLRTEIANPPTPQEDDDMAMSAEDREWFIYVLGWLTTGKVNSVVNPKVPEWAFADDATTFTLPEIVARIPSAEAIAAAVVAKLPAGSVDVAAVEAVFRRVLAEVRTTGHLEFAAET